MADKRDLKDIRPARGGVKLKPRKKDPSVEPPLARPKPAPKIIPDVASDVPADQVPPPTDEAIKVVSKLNDAKNQLLSSMKAFNDLLRRSTLPENKTTSEKEEERQVVADLIKAATAIEDVSPKEGILGLAIFAVRQALTLRDAGNSLAYELKQLTKRVEELEGQLKEKKDGSKEI